MAGNGSLIVPILIVIQLYLWATVIRAMLQFLNADFYNPFSLIIDRATKIPILILRRMLPRIGGSDILSPIALVVLCAGLERFIVLQQNSVEVNLSGLTCLILARVLRIVVYVFIGAVLARVIISWVSPRGLPITRLIVSVSEPVMKPFRKFIPTFGGMDFSPIAVFFVLQIINGTVVLYLESLGAVLLR